MTLSKLQPNRKAQLDAEMLEKLVKRTQKQAVYIKELEASNYYKDQVIDELNTKYGTNQKTIDSDNT